MMNKEEWDDAKRWEEQVHSDPDPPSNTGGAAIAKLLSDAGMKQRTEMYETQKQQPLKLKMKQSNCNTLWFGND